MVKDWWLSVSFLLADRTKGTLELKLCGICAAQPASCASSASWLDAVTSPAFFATNQARGILEVLVDEESSLG